MHYPHLERKIQWINTLNSEILLAPWGETTTQLLKKGSNNPINVAGEEYEVLTDGDGTYMPVYRFVNLGDVAEKRDGVAYIVTAEVKKANPDRDDFYHPYESQKCHTEDGERLYLIRSLMK